MVRRALVACSVLVVALTVFSGTSGAAMHRHIRPDQYFVGSVNGSLGVPTPATIKVICPGPAGGSGHPLAGQTVEVLRVPSPTVANVGFTGDSATSISAFFGVLPPSPTTIGPVSFSRYGVPEAIPTSISVPCGGTSTVNFIPFPRSAPTSRDASVPVTFANIAASGTP